MVMCPDLKFQVKLRSGHSMLSRLGYLHRIGRCSFSALLLLLFCSTFFSAAAQDSPGTQNTSSFDCMTVVEIPQAECHALVTLYNQMEGTGWIRSDGWLVTN